MAIGAGHRSRPTLRRYAADPTAACSWLPNSRHTELIKRLVLIGIRSRHYLSKTSTGAQKQHNGRGSPDALSSCHQIALCPL